VLCATHNPDYLSQDVPKGNQKKKKKKKKKTHIQGHSPAPWDTLNFWVLISKNAGASLGQVSPFGVRCAFFGGTY
jgi:hypothetical protein